MNIKYSNTLPYWARENDNKCSIKELEKFVSEMKTYEGNVNFVDDRTITLISKVNPNINNKDFKYYISFDQDGLTRYYYYKEISTITNGNYVCIYLLDFWSTYTIQFIKQNLENEFTFLRTHNYSPLCLQYSDKFLDELPKIYTSYEFKKDFFNKAIINDGNVNEETLWYSNNRAFSGKKLINANKYFVFKDNHGMGYRMYPILAIDKEIKVYEAEYEYEKTPYKEGSFKHGLANGNQGSAATQTFHEKVEEISTEANSDIFRAWKNGDRVELLWAQPIATYGTRLNFNWGQFVYEAKYGTMPRDVRCDCNTYNTDGGGFWGADTQFYVHGNKLGQHVIHGYTFGTITETSDNNRRSKWGTEIKYKLYKKVPSKDKYLVKNVKNNYVELNALMRKEENINKFIGIFYGVHFLNQKDIKYDDLNKLCYVQMETDNEIDYYKIYSYELSNIENKINNYSYSTPYLLKYLNIRYYGQSINSEYRTNLRNDLFIGGKYVFTDTQYLISKNNNLISLNNSLIQFPYMLPVSVDKYEQYVASNRNVTDTSYNNLKRQIDLQKKQNIFNGVINTANGVAQAGAGIVTGDIGSIVKGVSKSITSISDSIFKSQSLNMKLQNTQDTIIAQYKQAYNTMGDEMMYSNMESAILKEYYDCLDQQYEGVEVSKLSKETLILINNYIYLNGYFYQHTIKLKDMLDENRKFNYVVFDSILLLNQLTNKIKWFNNDIYHEVCEELINGVRIWNNFIIEEDDIFKSDDVKPPYNPPIPPQKPPISGNNVYSLKKD